MQWSNLIKLCDEGIEGYVLWVGSQKKKFQEPKKKTHTYKIKD